MIKPLATVAALCGAVLLAGCGGGGADNQQINQIQAKSLSYGKPGEIYIAGVYMRADMKVATGACQNPTWSARSTPELMLLNCTVSATGEQPLNITGSNGQVIYKSVITVAQPQVTMVTSLGNVVLELNPTVTPGTVNNFLAYVNSGYYNNTLFHRVNAGFVAQGGGYTAGLIKKPGQTAPIALETNKGLSNTRSSLAMARTTAADSATSEFYINLVDNPSLDYISDDRPGYAVFGKVVQGMDVVDAIAAVPTSVVNSEINVPITDVVIKVALQTK